MGGDQAGGRVHTVIVGGGMIGSCVAYELARRGVAVVVVDPEPGMGASVGNAGLLVPSYSLPMSNPAVLLAGVRAVVGGDPSITLARPLSLGTLGWLGRFALASRPGRAWRDAVRMHELTVRSRELYDEFEAAEDVDLGLRAVGTLHVVRDPTGWAAEVRTARLLTEIGIRHEELDATALAALEPGLTTTGIVGAIRFPDDAALDPERVTRAVADAAVRHGARFLRENVVGVHRSGSRIDAVETSGGVVRGAEFVLATGAGSSAVGRMFGARLPVEAGYGWSLTLPTDGPLLGSAVVCADEHVVLNPGPDRIRLTGGMLFGGRPTDPPSAQAITALRDAAERAVPALRNVTAAGTPWRGARPMTPSGLPIIRRIGVNLVVATGHGTLGMTLGPVTGRAVASLLAPTGAHGLFGAPGEDA